MLREPVGPVFPALPEPEPEQAPEPVSAVPKPLDLGSTSVDATSTAGEVAFAVLRRNFLAMLEREPGVRVGSDPEDLHQMRVAIRRMRAAMAVFEEALPARAPQLRKQLRWVGRLLGDVRDLDVQLSRIGSWSAAADPSERGALDVVTAVLEERQMKARARLVRAMDSARLQRLNASMERFLARGPVKRSPAASLPITAVAPEVVAHGYRKVVSIGDHIDRHSPREALHALRIRCKRLRYTVEFVEPIYGKPARSYAKRLVAMQDLLGEHQDAVVAIAVLREIAEKRRLDNTTVFAFGALAERYRTSGLEARERFGKRYAEITGGRWRKLRRALEDARPPKPAHPEPKQAETPAETPPPEEMPPPITVVRDIP
ncbi:MAG: CHAD domain-containing protein [Actinomycetota bacterium]